jgi:hypothetical protein
VTTREPLRRARAFAGASALAAAVTACYTPGYNTYATPRTTPTKKISTGVHLQVSGYSGEIAGRANRRYFAPTLPGVSGRVGLAERWDTGFRIGVGYGYFGASALHLGGDLKWHVLPGKALDIALNPALGFTTLRGDSVNEDGYLRTDGVSHWQLDAPLLAGINLARGLVVVVSPGVVLGSYASHVVPFDHAIRGRLVDGVAPRVGVALNARLGERVAIHPEATFVYSTLEANQRMIYTFGVGLQFGRLPKGLGD